jgi:uncharacterized protein (DUF2267 family)
MQYNEFIKKLQSTTGLVDEEAAVRATEATVSTLSERISAEEAMDMAAQLPEEIKQYTDVDEHAQRFSVDEFFDRVSKKEGANRKEAEQHSRAVMSVLNDAVTSGEIEDIKDQLPDDFDILFKAPPNVY